MRKKFRFEILVDIDVTINPSFGEPDAATYISCIFGHMAPEDRLLDVTAREVPESGGAS